MTKYDVNGIDLALEVLVDRTGLSDSEVLAGALMLLKWVSDRRLEGYNFAAIKAGTEPLEAVVSVLTNQPKGD